MGRASRHKKEVKKQRKYKKLIQAYKKNPGKWIEDMLGCKLYWYQKLMLKLFHTDINEEQYISFKNGSEITVIPTKSQNVRGNRANIISFYCDACHKWHIEVPKSEMVVINSDCVICKSVYEELLERR